MHEGAGRLVVDLGRGTDLLDLAGIHQYHPIRHLQRFLLIVGDEQAGDVQLVVQLAQPAAQLLAHLGVEGAEGLIQQQHLGLHRQRAGQRNPLTLAAGELGRIARGHMAELHQIQQLLDPGADRRLGRSLAAWLDPKAKRHVLEHRHVAKQGVVLEHEADVALAHVQIRGILAADDDVAAVGLLQPGDDPQQSGLAAAGGAEQRHQLTVVKIEVDVGQRRVLVEMLVESLYLNAHGSLLNSVISES